MSNNPKETIFTEEPNISFHKISLNFPDIDEIILLINEDRYFSKNQKIAKYTLKSTSKQVNESANTKKKFLYIEAPIYGKLVKYDKEEKLLILEECYHESFYYDVCAKCNYDKSKDSNSENVNKIRQNYSSLHPFLTFSPKKALEEEMAQVNKFLTSKKLILLLDLDNTILHTCPFHFSNDEFSKLKEKYKEYLAMISIRKELTLNTPEKIVVKFRPHLKELLSTISDKFVIYTYTHGTKEYASGIIQYINKYIYPESLSVDKLHARENGVIESKTIKKVFPTMEDMIIILDDRTNVWVENDENLINLYPYTFFPEGKINSNENLYDIKDSDHVLFSIMNMLNFVYEEFYGYYESNKMRKSVKIIINEKMSSIFNGMGFICSSVFDKKDIVTKEQIKCLIQKMGGELHNGISENENVDCLLVPEYLKTQKVIFFQKNKKTILHIWYIYICFRFFFKLDFDDFIISPSIKTLPTLDFEKLFQMHKNRIEEFYQSINHKTEEKKNE